MGRYMTGTIINEFATRPELLRRAIAQHQSWIEQQLGVPLSDVVILETDLDIAQIGVELFLGFQQAQLTTSSLRRRLRPFVVNAATPTAFPPICEIGKAPRAGNLLTVLNGQSSYQKSTLTWEDCPVALNLRRGEKEFTAITLNVVSLRSGVRLREHHPPHHHPARECL
jgi:hypothetical protein